MNTNELIQEIMNNKKTITVIALLFAAFALYNYILSPMITEIGPLEENYKIYKGISPIDPYSENLIAEYKTRLDVSNKEIEEIKKKRAELIEEFIAEDIKNSSNNSYVEQEEVNVKDYELIYVLSQLATNSELTISDLKVEERGSEQGIDLFVYGNYQNIVSYLESVMEIDTSFSFKNFKMGETIINAQTGAPILNYQSISPNINWSKDNSTYSPDKESSLFEVEDFDLIQKVQKQAEKQQNSIIPDSDIPVSVYEKSFELPIDKTEDIIIDEAALSRSNQYILPKDDLINAVLYYCNLYNVPAGWAMAIANSSDFFFQAQTFDDIANSNKIGIMQMDSSVFKSVANKMNKEYIEGIEYLPEFNIEVGVKYLSILREYYAKNYKNSLFINEEDFVFTNYHLGFSNAIRHYNKTSSYISSYSEEMRINTMQFAEMDLYKSKAKAPEDKAARYDKFIKDSKTMSYGEIIESEPTETIISVGVIDDFGPSISQETIVVDTSDLLDETTIESQIGLQIHLSIPSDSKLSIPEDLGYNNINKSKYDPFSPGPKMKNDIKF